MADQRTPAGNSNAVVWILRLEGGIVFALAIAAYVHLGASWWLFAVLILAPDLGALGYLRDERTGAWTYNLLHTYIGPAILASIGYVAAWPILYALAAIWVAHIGIDRLLGYGLKLPAGFRRTHLSLE